MIGGTTGPGPAVDDATHSVVHVRRGRTQHFIHYYSTCMSPEIMRFYMEVLILGVILYSALFLLL